MHQLADELEHIDVEPAVPPAPPVGRRLSPRWTAALIVAALVLGGVTAVPARTALARAGFRHADRILVTGHSLALEQQRLLGVLVTRSETGDRARMRRAEDRLRDELADRYAELRRSLRRDWRLRLDGQTDRFRLAVQRTLEPPVGDPAIASAAEYQARSLRARWDVTKPAPDTGGLHSVDAEVAALQRYVDRPTDVRLIVGTRDGLTELDLDASRRRDRVVPGLVVDAPVTRLVAGPEWVAISDRGQQGWALTDRLDRTIGALGTGVPFATPGHDAVSFWATNLHTLSSLDPRGRPLGAPTPLPPRTAVVGIGHSGVVLVDTDGPALSRVWAPTAASVVREIPGRAVAVTGDLVAWVEIGPAPMTHVTTVADGTDVARVPLWGDVGAFSPDGRRLALGSPRGLIVVDLADGRVDHVPTTSFRGTPVWAPSGRFLFFQGDGFGGWDVTRHEMFRPRIPRLASESVLLAALAA